MANLISNLQKILEEETDLNSPVSEQLLTKIGSSLNGLIDLAESGWQIFLTSGTWTAPEGATRVDLLGAGGGQGGSAGDNNGIEGSGGNGAVPYFVNAPVIAGEDYSVTIGAGGQASLTGTDLTASTYGFATTFTGPANPPLNSLNIRFEGAVGGLGKNTVLGSNACAVSSGLIYTLGGDNDNTLSGIGNDGANSPYSSGGNYATADDNETSGGGGAGFGKGGNGAPKNGTAQAGGISAGGGGGWGQYNATPADGGSGILLVRVSNF